MSCLERSGIGRRSAPPTRKRDRLCDLGAGRAHYRAMQTALAINVEKLVSWRHETGWLAPLVTTRRGDARGVAHTSHSGVHNDTDEGRPLRHDQREDAALLAPNSDVVWPSNLPA
jgi:hypothetical protein